MGNNGSFMEKVYVYLPVIMCHSKIDYGDRTTMRYIRLGYFLEQAAVLAFTAHFLFAVRRNQDHRKILVPDISHGQALVNNVPKPEEVMYRRTTFFQREMTEVFQQLQQLFVAFMLTVLAHFVLGIRPVLLLQIFATPYHFTENRLLRKHVLGLKPGYRVWGERFDGEVEADRIKEDPGQGGGAEATTAAAVAAGDGDGGGDGGDGVGGGVGVGGGDVEVVGEVAVIEAAPVVPATDVKGTSETVAGEEGEDSLPMPRGLEDALIDAWEAAGSADWKKVADQLDPFSVNTRTPTGNWTPLMVACGLHKVTEEEIRSLISDLDARVDLRDDDGWTCLHWAAQQGRAEAVRAVFGGIEDVASEPTAAATTVARLRASAGKDGGTAADVARDAGLEDGKLGAFLEALQGGGGGSGGEGERSSSDTEGRLGLD